MAAGDLVADDEEVVRALHYPLWDEATQRATTSAFMQSEISVSRPAVLEYSEIVRIFKSDLDGKVCKDGKVRMVVATATVVVRSVLDLCNVPDATVAVSVVEDPTHGVPGIEDNLSHALILGRDQSDRKVPKNLTRGMANRIRTACRYRPVA